MQNVTEFLLTADIKELTAEIEDILEDNMIAFQNDLIQKGQDVYDTGEFKNSNMPLTQYSTFHFEFINTAFHSSILARGRRVVNGMWMGSEHWAGGIDPMVDYYEKKIQKEADAIRI